MEGGNYRVYVILSQFLSLVKLSIMKSNLTVHDDSLDQKCNFKKISQSKKNKSLFNHNEIDPL